MANSGSVGTPRKLVLALAATLTTVAVNAEPVDVIYSAENALYGAGYDIGVADGWMDDQLRAAIRQYQSSRNDLQTTGHLDVNTLFSLGITTENGAPVTDNQLPDRQAALSALGLSTSDLPSGGSVSTAETSAPEPTPQPEPEPETTPEREPQPAPVAESPPGQAQTAARADDEEQTQPPATTESDTSAAGEPEESEAESARTDSQERQGTPEESQPEEAPEPTRTIATISATGAQSESAAEPDPEQAGPEDASQPDEDDPQTASQSTAEGTGQDSSSGGFFNWLYDFFFGWMF